MESTLTKLRLKENFTVEIKGIGKNDFINRFRKNVDKSDLGTFDGLLEVFRPGRNVYKGKVGIDQFEIKRRRRFFDRNQFMSKAMGKYSQQADIIRIDAEVNGLSNFAIFTYVFMFIVYAVFVLTLVLAGDAYESMSILFFIVIHALFMLGFIYFSMRKSVRNMVNDLKQDFIFFANRD